MPLQKLAMRPGVNRENTRYTNEGGWYESDKVRFRQGTPEKIGGWLRLSTNKFLGICRSLWNWFTLNSADLMGVGTHLKFYIERFGTYNDITPFRSTSTLTDPITTTAGSSTVAVLDATLTVYAGDFVRFFGATAVGGVTLQGEYQIQSVVGTTYYVDAGVPASSSATGGGTVYAAYQIPTGYAQATPTSGWGASTWGAGVWGSSAVYYTNIGIWNQLNWGEDLVFGQRGGALYYWDATVGYAPTVANITIGAPAVVTTEFVSTNNMALIFSTTGKLPTGLIPGVTYYVVNSAGVTCNVSATPGGAPITTSGTQAGVHSVLPNGTALATAYGASGVPIVATTFLISDVSRFVIVFGTNDYLGTVLDPMLVRWSDQSSLTEWAPAVTNQAGSIRLSHGSKIITAMQSRQEVLVWTDSALYNLQYVGPPYVWSSQLLADNVSLIGPNAVAVASNVVYWMGADKFYMYDGRVQTLNCDLRQYIYDDINFQQYEQCFASTSEGFNEVWFFYCSADSTTVNRYVVYNYMENVWYYGTMERSAWIDSGLRPFPTAATYANNLVQHEYGVDDGTGDTLLPIEAYITSSQFDIGDGDHMAFVWRLLPDLTFRGSTSGTEPALTMYLQPLRNSGSGYNVPRSVAGPDSNGSAAVDSTLIPATPVQVDEYTGQVYIRVRGRQMSMKVLSNKLGTHWQMGAPRIDVRNDGRR